MPEGSEGKITVTGSEEALAARSGVVTTLEAVVIKADGRRIDYGVIASSNPELAPLSPRPEEE